VILERLFNKSQPNIGNMSISNKFIYLMVASIALIILLLIGAYLGMFGALQTMSSSELTLLFTEINGVSTIVFALVATVNMIESRKARGEMVKPHLALEPAFFDYDMKTGDIIGFTCLNLVNGGAGARDVEIDFCCKGKCSALYASSVGTNDRVQIWNGKFSELGGNVTVNVNYRNMFNKSLEEKFMIDIDSIIKAKRKFVPVLNPANSK
jgi:hypothetical protein